MTAPLQALIFDVDGTLADTEAQHLHAFNATFERLQLDFRWSREEYRGLLRTTGGKERLTAFFRRHVCSEAHRARLLARVPEIHAEKTRRYVDAVRAGLVPLRPGVAGLIAEAHEAGCRLAVASTTTLANIDALLSATLGKRGLDRFCVIAAGDAVARKKPAPDVYLHALAKLGVPAQAAIAFEDSENGLRAARAAGLWTVVTPTYWTEHDDFTGAGLVLPSLHEPTQMLQSLSSGGTLKALALLAHPEHGVSQARR